MTPEDFMKWLLPLALTGCTIGGFAVIVVCIRGGWRHPITWAVVSFGLIGSMMMLSPKWSTFAFEWGELKATVAQLREENTKLLADNTKYAQQINEVASIGSGEYGSAEDLVNSIEKARARVSWADFLPTGKQAYGVPVSLTSASSRKLLENQIGISAAIMEKALKDNNWTLVKPATDVDLTQTPAASLWITPPLDAVHLYGQDPQMHKNALDPGVISPTLP